MHWQAMLGISVYGAMTLRLRNGRRFASGVVLGVGLAVAATMDAFAAPLGISADPWQACGHAIAVVEREQGVPRHLLSAIALAESGRTHPALKRRLPWPWTVTAEGRGRYLPSKAAAVAEVREVQSRGIRNIDVGCMQVNLLHHPDAFVSIESAFDPVVNATYAAEFLRSLFASSGSWHEAAGQYHSATPEFKIPYKERVLAFWNEEQRRDRLGGSVTAAALNGSRAMASLQEGSRLRTPAAMLSRSQNRFPLDASQDPGSLDSSQRGGRLLRPGAGRTYSGDRIPVRSLDEQAAFAMRRVQYLQELREAMAEARRSFAMGEKLKGGPSSSSGR